MTTKDTMKQAPAVEIDRVIVILEDPDSMEKIGALTGISDSSSSDIWCDFSDFEEYPELKDFISSYEFEALKNGQADYIAFRMDY